MPKGKQHLQQLKVEEVEMGLLAGQGIIVAGGARHCQQPVELQVEGQQASRGIVVLRRVLYRPTLSKAVSGDPADGRNVSLSCSQGRGKNPDFPVCAGDAHDHTFLI